MSGLSGKVLVVGGTGKVGLKVIKELRSLEVPVRVLVRNLDSAGRIPLLASDDNVEVVQGDVTDKQAVSQAARGTAAIIDVHGVSPLRFTRISDLWRDPFSDPGHPASVNFAGVQNVVAACKEHGITRLVRLTGLSVSLPASSPVVCIFGALLSGTVKWHRRSEILIRESGLDYTIVQPSGLRDEAAARDSGNQLLLQCEALAAKPTLPAASGISRCDVASLCVAALGSDGCKKATLRCVSLQTGKPIPPGVEAASEWQSLLSAVQPDTAVLADQNYAAYSTAGVSMLLLTAGVFLFGVGKLLAILIGMAM